MKQQSCCSSSPLPPPPPPPPPLSFPSLSSLSAFLKSHIPSDSLSSWGLTPGTKTLNNLYLEIANGESSLLASPSLTRTVNVAVLHIKNPRGSTLLESQQLLSDGTLRSRNRPLSEKMMPGESIEDAAASAVREELGEKVRVRVLMEMYWVEVDDEKESVSYPGLPARYLLHCVDAVLEQGVPEEGEFETEEHGEEIGHEGSGGGAGDSAVFVRKHIWPRSLAAATKSPSLPWPHPNATLETELDLSKVTAATAASGGLGRGVGSGVGRF